MILKLRAERAVSPTDGRAAWVVIDDQLRLQEEASAFLEGLSAADRSINTERVYAGRVALFLSWCEACGVRWTEVSMLDLARFLRWLVSEPLPSRGRGHAGPRYRSKKTANAVMTTVCEFLRFGAREGWIDPAIVGRLSQQKYLGWLPKGFDPGEDNQNRQVRAKLIKFNVGEDPVEILHRDEIARLLAAAVHCRDRFLIALLDCTGIRIGESLGLRRADMHLLADSQALGCRIGGPHIHIHRRPENANGALAKSRHSRSIPVTADLVGLYTDYQYERDHVPEAAACDMVFVNLFHAPLGEPMRYWSAKELFDRLARQTDMVARPHMVRHGTATAWIRAGVDRDVVSNLMGHASPASLAPYLHATSEEKRQAVDLVAAGESR